jgi:hypothetical protein
MRFTALIYEDPEERLFGGVVPELPGCVTQGEEMPEQVGLPIIATVEVEPDFASLAGR